MVQQALFPQIVCHSHLLAENSPKKAFYKIWIEGAGEGIFLVRKESGAKDKVLDRRCWQFDNLDDAKKSYSSRVKYKTNQKG